MNVYFTDSFQGHWPVGAAMCLVVAGSKRKAKLMLEKEMKKAGLEDQFEAALEGFRQVFTTVERVVMFKNGDY